MLFFRQETTVWLYSCAIFLQVFPEVTAQLDLKLILLAFSEMSA